MITRIKYFLFLVFAGLALLACDSQSKDQNQSEHDEHSEEAREHDEAEEGIIELSADAEERMRIEIARVERRLLPGVLTTTGRVDFNQDRLAHVSPRVSGRVHLVKAKLGDTVKKGQTLAIIDSIELGRAKSVFLGLRAQLRLATETLRREEDLLKDKITSEQSVLEARSNHQRQRAAYQAARQELQLFGLSSKEIDSSKTKGKSAALFSLSSPIEGTLVEKHVTLGEVVSPERNLFTVADLSQVWIWIDIYERDLANVHLEDEVAVKVDAFPDRIFEGRLEYIRNQVDADTRTVRARIHVPNAERQLRPGMFANITVTDPHGTEGKEGAETLVMPAKAVQRDGQQEVAFVRIAERRYERRIVTLGRRTAAFVEVRSGLTEGERVAVEGTFLLKSEAAKTQMGGGHGH